MSECEVYCIYNTCIQGHPASQPVRQIIQPNHSGHSDGSRLPKVPYLPYVSVFQASFLACIALYELVR